MPLAPIDDNARRYWPERRPNVIPWGLEPGIRMKALIVEDDKYQAMLLREIMVSLGHQTVVCGSSDEAIAIHQNERHSLVIIDWGLPGMNGADLCRRMRQLPGGDRSFVLAITAKNGINDLFALLDAGVDDYQPKPINVEMLKIRLAIGERRVRDMTLKLQAENALRENEVQLRAIMESALDPIITVDHLGVVRSASQSVEKVFGWSPKELVGRSAKMLGPEKYFTLPSTDGESTQRRRPRQFDAQRRDGSRFPCEISVWRVSLPGQAHPLLTAIIRDITARKEAEEELTRSESRFRTLIENASEVITILDAQAVVRFESSSVERMLGYRPSELIGSNAFSLVHPEDWQRTVSIFDDVIQKPGSIRRSEFRVRHRDGRWRMIEAIINNQLIDPLIAGVVINSRDITDRKVLEEQLRHAQKLEAVGQLAGGIAHDFNNLLVGITGNVSLAMEDAPPALSPLLRDALKASGRAADLVRQLLAFGRKTPVIIRPTNITPIVEEVVGIIRETFDRRYELTYRLKEPLRPIMADASQIHQVLLNLCINARDALEAALELGSSPALCLFIGARNIEIDDDFCRTRIDARPGKFVEVTVADTGIGMDQKTQMHVFEPFFTTKEIGKGTGLGLATVHGILKQHGGWIDVESTVGSGATFTFFLPAATEEELIEDEELSGQMLPGGNETILFVDDEEMIRDFGKRVLERAGYSVLEARDGEECLEVYSRGPHDIDLIVLDLSMPRLSGQETLTRLRLADSKVKVIVSTGRGSENWEIEDERLEAAAVVRKPYPAGNLLRTVRRVLDEQR